MGKTEKECRQEERMQKANPKVKTAERMRKAERQVVLDKSECVQQKPEHRSAQSDRRKLR